MTDRDLPFWVRKPLTEMTREEWESLCDGCGKCCLTKLEDAETGDVYYTDVSCRLLDVDRCRCTHYADRHRHVPDCAALTPAAVREFRWLPRTCAYRLIAEGKPLEWWHPLVSGDADSVHRAGISVRGRATPETLVQDEDLEDRIVDWDG